MTVAATLASFRRDGHTLANSDRDFVEWHQGRPRYYCWVILVDAPDWSGAVSRAANALSPWLVPGYQRPPHVTILPGGFPGSRIDAEALSAAMRQIQPFSLHLGGLGSFTSSPCFEVGDPADALLRMRRLLRPILCDSASRVGDEDYQPHMTVGLYSERFSTEEITRRIVAFENGPVNPVEVGGISLCCYDTRSIKGPLNEVAAISLGSGILSIRNQSDPFR